MDQIIPNTSSLLIPASGSEFYSLLPLKYSAIQQQSQPDKQ